MAVPNHPFFDRPPDAWDILAYLNQHDPKSPSYNHQITLDRWSKALEAIVNDRRCSLHRSAKAQLLLDQFKNPGRGSDRNRARDWLCRHQPNKKRKQVDGASVNIFHAPVNQGTFNNATFDQGPSKKRLLSPKVTSLPDIIAGMPGKVSGARTIYQAPVNQGTFNNSSFDQAGHSRRSPDPTTPLRDEDGEVEDDADEGQSVDQAKDQLGEDQYREDIAPESEIIQNHDTFTEVYNKFVATYECMSSASKFVFSESHRILEDLIFENASNLKVENSAHLWVIDLCDDLVTSWFLPTELDELRRSTLPLPETDKLFVASMARFSRVDTAEEYRHIAEKIPYRPEDENYNRSKHFDAAWVNTVILSMLSILESPNNLLLYPSLREGWFDCNPWAFLIDQCLLGLDGVLVQRKEIICIALNLVENLRNAQTGKGYHGRRFDAIIHTLGDSPAIEYGAIEVSKSFESVQSKKWTTDSVKLVRALRAMLCRLHQLVDHNKTTIKKLQVAGLLNAGLNIQVIRMNSLNTNVFLLERGKIRSVPATVKNLKNIFHVMISIRMFKHMIRDCVNIIQSYNSACDGNNQTEQELFTKLMAQNDL